MDDKVKVTEIELDPSPFDLVLLGVCGAVAAILAGNKAAKGYYLTKFQVLKKLSELKK